MGGGGGLTWYIRLIPKFLVRARLVLISSEFENLVHLQT